MIEFITNGEMNMNKTFRTILGGISAAIIMIVSMMLIHSILFEKYWDMVSMMRAMEEWPFTPWAPVAVILWNIFIAWFFAKFYKAIPGKGLKKGLNFGLLFFLLFAPFVELWNYLQFDIPFMVVIAGILCYLIAFPLGGVAIAAIYGKSLEKE